MDQEVSQMKSDLVLAGTKTQQEISDILKEAGYVTSTIGNVLNKVAPETTRDFIRPMWQGAKREWSAGNRSFDGLLGGGLKTIEANRFNQTGLGQKAQNFGISLNKDMHGRPIYDNAINYSKSFDNLKNSLSGWVSNLGNVVGGFLNNNFSAPTQNNQTSFINKSAPSTLGKYASNNSVDEETRKAIVKLLL